MKEVEKRKDLVYGPVSSRRLGASLGINLMPSHIKICPFNCVYCHCGWTDIITKDIDKYFNMLPDILTIEKALEEKLRELKENNKILNYITFSGNGEGSLHPDFDNIVNLVTELRNQYFPDAKTCILSNSTSLLVPHSLKAMRKLDRRVMKLDGGSREIFNMVNKPAEGITFEKIIDALGKLEHFTIQTNFFGGSISNSGNEAVEDWINIVGKLKPDEVMIYTVARPTADLDIKKITEEELIEIAEKIQILTGINTCAY
jgi:wyosine [tRNA(Phe)-imidazoG37] synthetase (radical SAM superfamily)